MRKNVNVYAVYRGDRFIDLGTKEELASKLKVTPEYIRRLTTPAYKKRRENKKRNTEDQLIVVKIGKIGDEF